ncbi:hypothetical protein Taro_006039, partial [Colocasia esculenta]|nr:hypothetical protein [Colocasia esculenta]
MDAKHDLGVQGPCRRIRSLQLCCACRPERLASISLDAWISVGIQVWTLTPPQRPGVDAKGPSARTLRKDRSTYVEHASTQLPQVSLVVPSLALLLLLLLGLVHAGLPAEASDNP